MPRGNQRLKDPEIRDSGQPWEPGKSQNPKGRQVPSFAEIMVKELARPYDKSALDKRGQALKPMTNKERIVAMFVARAAAGDLQAFIELMNRTEGKVPDQLMAQVEHAVKVVPWDDEDDRHFVYVEDQNKGDRGDNHRMDNYKRPGDVPALPDMYPPLETQVKGLDQAAEAAQEAEFTVKSGAGDGDSADPV